jgi:hypothetical protein
MYPLAPTFHRRSPARRLLLAALVAGLLVACGGGGRSAPDADPPGTPASVEIEGVAASGAAIAQALVTAVDVTGASTTTRTDANGHYTIRVGEAGPYLLRVADASGRSWYSYAPSGGTANLTPLTTLALLQANGHRPLDALGASWPTRALAPGAVIDAAKIVNANLGVLLQAQGVDPSRTNVFTVRFAADGSGLDAVLDTLHVRIECSAGRCLQTIDSGNLRLSWREDIATPGFTLDWSGDDGSGGVAVGIGSCRNPRAGTYSLIVQTSVSGAGAGSIDEVCIDGLPDKPAGPSDFCGDSRVRQQLPVNGLVVSCSFAGDSGVIEVHLGAPVVLTYAVRFVFVKR